MTQYQEKSRRNTMKKKEKIIIIISIILIISLLIIPPIKEKSMEKSLPKEQLNLQILASKINNEEINADFLSWIKEQYGEDPLIKIDKYLNNNSYSPNIWHTFTKNSLIVLKDLYNNKYQNMNNIQIINTDAEDITISFIGDVSLADNWYIMPKYDERKKQIYGILSPEVVDILNGSNITIANNEFTISNRGEQMPGKYYTFISSPERLNIYHEMGVDLVTLANNHVYDFGKDAFLDTLEELKKQNIMYIGAGKNKEEAKLPFYYVVNGYKIGFINATRAEKIILTPEATEESPGVFRCYNPEELISQITDMKKEADYVVLLVHWGREDSHDLEEVQKITSHQYIDAGADLIVGTHAHVLQGVEFYNNKPIIYNIGDFIFNNETKDTVIFNLKINNSGVPSYNLIPCIESNEYTSLLEGTDKERVLSNINSWSINTQIDSKGNVSATN